MNNEIIFLIKRIKYIRECRINWHIIGASHIKKFKINIFKTPDKNGK